MSRREIDPIDIKQNQQLEQIEKTLIEFQNQLGNFQSQISVIKVEQNNVSSKIQGGLYFFSAFVLFTISVGINTLEDSEASQANKGLMAFKSVITLAAAAAGTKTIEFGLAKFTKK